MSAVNPYGLSSDDPQNPAAALGVWFVAKPVYMEFESKRVGRPIFEMRDFIHKETAGDRNTVIERVAWEQDKLEFPLQWARYKNQGADAQGVVGTALEQWPLISAAQAEELKGLKFRTVEQVAGASDASITNIGMIGGMAPLALRQKARDYLHAAANAAKLQESDALIAKKDAELQAVRDQSAQAQAEANAKLEALQAQMNALMEKLTAQPPPAPAKRRGRPPKQAAA